MCFKEINKIQSKSFKTASGGKCCQNDWILSVNFCSFVVLFLVRVADNLHIHEKNLRIDTPNRMDMRNFFSCVSVFHLQIKTIHFKSPNYKKTCFSADSFCYAKIKDKSLFVENINICLVNTLPIHRFHNFNTFSGLLVVGENAKTAINSMLFQVIFYH